jgi:hypothetical protein
LPRQSVTGLASFQLGRTSTRLPPPEIQPGKQTRSGAHSQYVVTFISVFTTRRDLPLHSESQRDAEQIADRILTARSESYVLRWCKRSDVDAIDLDIVYHNLLRPRGRNGRRTGFLSLGEIAEKHGVSRQSAAKVALKLSNGGQQRREKPSLVAAGIPEPL